MADEQLVFDIIGHDAASDAFSRVGRAAGDMSARMDIAAVQAKVLDAALRRQAATAAISAGATLALARADKILADAEDDAVRKWAALAARQAASRGSGGGILGTLFGSLGGGTGAAAGAGPLAAAAGAVGPAGIGIGAAAVIGSGALGIVPVLAAAAAGVAAFGALAIPTFTAVTGAVTALKADTAAYDAATTAAAKNTALAKIKADWAALDPAQQQAVKGIQALQASFSALAAKLEPVTLKVLNAGLKAANDLLPALLPLARAAGNAIATLLGGFDKFAQSAGFKAFIANMARLAGPAILAIGEGFGKVAVSLGKLLVAMESPDALRILNGLFTALAGTINVIAFLFTKLTPVVIRVFHDIAVAFDDLRHNVANDVHQISDYIDTIRVTWVTVGHAIEAAWNNIAAKFDAFRHRTAVVFDGVRGDIARTWDLIWNNTVGRVTRGIADVVRFFTGLPAKVISALSSLGTKLLNVGTAAMGSLLSGFVSIGSTILTWVGNFAKSVLNAIGSPFGIHFSDPSVSTVFHKIGVSIMTGLMNGLQAKLPALALHAQQVANAVTGQFSAAAGSVEALMQKMAAARGWTGAQWTALRNVEIREAGFSLTARNPTSGAYGLAQFIGGPAEYYQYGGNPNTAAGQITAMLSYIAQRYGTPSAAWAHEQAFGWYDRGGWLQPGWSLALNTTGRPERILPADAAAGGWDWSGLIAEMRALRAEVRELTGVAAAIPRRTGEHVGGAISGAAASASFRVRYP